MRGEDGLPVVRDGRVETRTVLLPAPAEAGPDVFALADQDVVRFLKRRVANARFEAPDRPN